MELILQVYKSTYCIAKKINAEVGYDLTKVYASYGYA
jgi:hypothetical protein